MAEIAILKSTLHNNSFNIESVTFHPTAPLLATGDVNDTVKLWRFLPDGSNAICVANLYGHHGWVLSVAFHPIEPLLASGCSSDTVKLWRFSPDGSEANNMQATCVATLREHRRSVNSVAFHPIEPLLATGSGDNTVKLWRFSPDGSAANNMQATCVATLVGHSNCVNSVAFHPIEPLLATGSGDHTVKLWNLSPDGLNANCVATLVGHNESVNSVAFHPIKPLLATGSNDNSAKLWHFSPNGSAANNMQAICVATLVGHSNWVFSVAFHQTKLLLATGSKDKTVKLWSFSPNGLEVACVATLTGHNFDVFSVAFHQTKPLLATSSEDRTAKLWELNLRNIRNIRNRLSASSNLPALTISRNRDGRINIPREYRLESKNPANKSCPNFKPLYDQIMLIDLDEPFRFHFKGESGRDATGLTKIVYDFLLPVYTKLYFEFEVVEKAFLLLKERISIEELNRDTS